MKMAIEVTTDLNIENTKLVLDGLSRCRGIDRYNVSVHVDDGCPGMLDMLRNHPLRHVRFLKAFRIGRDCNVYAAMENGFQDADYVVHLDDTAVPHPSFLEMHEHCKDHFDSDEDVVGITCLGNRDWAPGDYEIDVSDDELYGHRKAFYPTGFGTWKKDWKFLSSNWYSKNNAELSWHESVSLAMRWRVQVYPKMNFSRPIPAKSAVAA